MRTLAEKEEQLQEVIADIAFNAGSMRPEDINSRHLISCVIIWAKEFQQMHSETDWEETDYISTIDAYAAEKLKEYFSY